jgi:hypothetical protein
MRWFGADTARSPTRMSWGRKNLEINLVDRGAVAQGVECIPAQLDMHSLAFTVSAGQGRFNSWRGNRSHRFYSSLFLYVDNEVIIASRSLTS